jgi:hypothetical protein
VQCYRVRADAACYPRGVKKGVDVLLSGLAAAATALLLALIARDDIGIAWMARARLALARASAVK